MDLLVQYNQKVSHQKKEQELSEFSVRFNTFQIITNLSDSFCGYIGKPKVELVGTPFYEVFPESFKSELLSLYSKVCSVKRTEMMNLFIETHQGDLIWFDLELQVSVGKNNQIYEFEVFGKNPHYTKLYEPEIQNNFNHNSVLILRASPDGKIIFANETICEFLGKSKSEFENDSILDHTYTVDLFSEKEFYNKLSQNKDGFYNTIKFDQSYGEKWIEWHLVGIYSDNDELLEIMAAGMDVSLRKEIENKILKYNDYVERKVRERIQKIKEVNEVVNDELEKSINSVITFENSFKDLKEGAIILDEQAIIQRVNKTAANILHLPEEKQFVHKKIFEILNIQNKTDVLRYIALFRKKQQPEYCEVLIDFKGQLVAVEISLSLIKNFTCEKNNYILIVREISERKIKEERIQKHLVKKEKFIKEIRHRVKNTLQVIYSILSIQTRFIKDPGAIQIVESSQHRIRMMSIAYDYIYRTNDYTRVNIPGFFNYLTNSFNDIINERTYDIDLYFKCDDFDIDSTSAATLSILFNEVLTNCIDHAFDDYDTGEINIDIVKKENECYLTIKDTGIGIPDHCLNTKTNSLGLRLIQIISAQLNGKYNFENNNGTEFSLVFPIKEIEE